MSRIVVVTAGLSTPSSTRLLADRLGEAVTSRVADAGIEVIELRELAHAIADTTLTGFAAGDLAAAIESIRNADAMIAVTPVFAASYSGLFKSFFDILEPGLLEGLPVLLGATAGTPRHSLALEHALRPLFGYLKAVAVPTAVFAATGDWGSETESTALRSRIARAAGELADQLVGRRTPRPASGPVFDESSEGFVDFSSLLG